MTKKQQWVLYGKCWSMYPIIHLSVSRKMSTWEEWRVGPYHQPWSTAHPWYSNFLFISFLTALHFTCLLFGKCLLVCLLKYPQHTGTGLKCLSKYDVIKLPPPTSTPNDDTVGKEGKGGENVSESDGVILGCSLSGFIWDLLRIWRHPCKVMKYCHELRMGLIILLINLINKINTQQYEL